MSWIHALTSEFPQSSGWDGLPFSAKQVFQQSGIAGDEGYGGEDETGAEELGAVHDDETDTGAAQEEEDASQDDDGTQDDEGTS